MKINDRLKTIGDLADANSFCLDVGCDHAFLDIYLVKRGDNINAIASDIAEGPLEQAKKNIKAEKLEGKIEVRLGNGLDTYSDEIDTVIISGMGSNTIVGILKYAKDKLVNVNNIIVQSNTDLYFLRKNITSIGYYIEDEVLVEDKNIIYTVIKFSRGKRKYNYKELYLGPVLMSKNDNLFRKKNEKELKTMRMIIGNITKGHYFYRCKVKKNIKVLESVLR